MLLLYDEISRKYSEILFKEIIKRMQIKKYNNVSLFNNNIYIIPMKIVGR